MDTAYLSALAALTGTAVGGSTSFFSTWLAQKAQFKAQLFLHDKGRRQELYRDFVHEASQLYIDALTNDQPNLSKTITLYALVSQMRFISSPKVIEEAEKVARLILETYPKPNKTFSELRDMAHDMAHEQSLDPLRRFSESCREELQGVAAL
jgi:folate-binding Fe-S cluster repair protein YgfZ